MLETTTNVAVTRPKPGASGWGLFGRRVRSGPSGMPSTRPAQIPRGVASEPGCGADPLPFSPGGRGGTGEDERVRFGIRLTPEAPQRAAGPLRPCGTFSRAKLRLVGPSDGVGHCDPGPFSFSQGRPRGRPSARPTPWSGPGQPSQLGPPHVEAWEDPRARLELSSWGMSLTFRLGSR